MSLSNNKIRLLYVGNDPDTLNLLSQPDLFHLEHKENSLLAMEYLSHQPGIDAIICEYNMPGVNGLSFFDLINNQLKDSNKSLFIILTGQFDENLRKSALSKGVHDVYTKPIDAGKVHTRLSFLAKYPPEANISAAGAGTAKDTYKMPIIKRLFDIVGSGLGLFFLSPFFLMIAILIRFESKGPVFYAAKRVGTGYRIFPFYKFRSMYTGADLQLKSLAHQNQYAAANPGEEDIDVSVKCPYCEASKGFCSTPLYIEDQVVCENRYLKQKQGKSKAAFIKILNDPRVTRIGRFIRKTSIDELPQLYNVLVGDMSIVGNRPLPLYEAEMLTSDHWVERFLGPAGITGLWQVNKRGKQDMSDEERKQLDNQYARNYSFWGDIKIILKTIPALMQKENV